MPNGGNLHQPIIDLFRIGEIVIDTMPRISLENFWNGRRVFFGMLLFLHAVLSGCGSASRNESDKPHYIYLPPQTGSNVPRRVKVNPDGTLADGSVPSSVESGDARILQDAQRKGQTVPGGR